MGPRCGDGPARPATYRHGVAIYFCDPKSPWQRGTSENTNGLLSQYLPKGTDLSKHSAQELAGVAATLNTRPRKTLSWRTPAEALHKLLLSAQEGGVATTASVHHVSFSESEVLLPMEINMSSVKECEFCDRPMTGTPVQKVLRGKTHTFCSEFCFRLFFYRIPDMKYSDVKKMYAARAVDLVPQDMTKYLTKVEVEA